MKTAKGAIKQAIPEPMLKFSRALLSYLRFGFAFVNLVYLYVVKDRLPLLPIPDQIEYWRDRLEKEFANIPLVENDPYYKKLFERQIGLLKDAGPAESFLEVGCYFGYRASKVAKLFPEKKITGIDLSQENINFGRQKLDVSKNLNLEPGDVTNLKYEDRSFDVVYTVVCLSHIPYSEIGRATEELARVCNKRIILIEIDLWIWEFRKKLKSINISHMYFHKYTDILLPQFQLQEVIQFYFGENSPRYSAFVFDRAA